MQAVDSTSAISIDQIRSNRHQQDEARPREQPNNIDFLMISSELGLELNCPTIRIIWVIVGHCDTSPGSDLLSRDELKNIAVNALVRTLHQTQPRLSPCQLIPHMTPM